MTRRRLFIFALVLGVVAAPLAAEAQPAGKVYRIGLLYPGSSFQGTSHDEAFRQGLRELGYVVGPNVVIEYRLAGERYERLRDLARDLVRLKVDVIVAVGPPAVQAAKDVTKTIPIVLLASDPVEAGLVDSLARPGSNVTGLAATPAPSLGKLLQLLKEVNSKTSRVAVLWDAKLRGSFPLSAEEHEAQSLGVELQPVEVQSPSDLESSLVAIGKGRITALCIPVSPLLYGQRAQIVAFAKKSRLLTIANFREFVEAGGLMTYGVSLSPLYRRLPTFVDKILKGTKPADLPVEQPTKFELVINLKTAKTLGLTIPQSVLIRADEVIQ